MGLRTRAVLLISDSIDPFFAARAFRFECHRFSGKRADIYFLFTGKNHGNSGTFGEYPACGNR